MNKLLTSAILAAGFVVAGATSAFAIPTMTYTMDTAGATAGECAALGGASSGTTCTFVSTTGLLSVTGTYGAFFFNSNVNNGNGTGPASVPQPALWINSLQGAATAGALTTTLTVKDYSYPDVFVLLAGATALVANPNMSVDLKGYLDLGNTNVAGAGELVLHATSSDLSTPSGISSTTNVVNTDTYGLSWILNVTSLATSFSTTGVSGTFLSAPVPTPAPLALLGLGLAGLAFLRRRKSNDATA